MKTLSFLFLFYFFFLFYLLRGYVDLEVHVHKFVAITTDRAVPGAQTHLLTFSPSGSDRGRFREYT